MKGALSRCFVCFGKRCWLGASHGNGAIDTTTSEDNRPVKWKGSQTDPMGAANDTALESLVL